MSANQLKLAVLPQEFFRERLTAASHRLNISVDDHTEFYIVNLLCEFITLDRINSSLEDTSVDIMSTPLALILKKAVESPPAVRLRLLKRLGDTSLYMAGFFQDYFNRKTFDIGYYATLGASAYQHVSNLMRDSHRDEHISGVYDQLSQNFMQMVDLVAEVSTMPGKAAQPIDVLAVYDRWTRCNSDRLRRILHDNGITPIETRTKLAQ